MTKEEFEEKLNEIQYYKTNNYLNLDKIVKLSLGYELNSGEMKIIIPRNNLIPIKKKFILDIRKDYQKEIEMKIYEGERLIAKNNNLLKKFLIFIPKKIKGEVIVNCSFKIDDNYILYVKSKIDNKTQINKIQIDKNRNEDEIYKIIQNCEKMKDEDIEELRKLKEQY